MNGLHSIIHETGTSGILTTAGIDEPVKLLSGDYEVEVLTLPRSIYHKVKIVPGRTTHIDLATPGIMSITDNTPGYGSIYEIPDNGVGNTYLSLG